MAGYVLPGDILADKYLVERVLGEGGMATVVAARHLQLHQMVAIKLMRTRALAFPDAVERFMREAKTVVRLKSENVARVMDVGMLEDSTPYMVMEHLEGVDLDTVLAHYRVLAVEDAVDYVLQACAAMAEAHAAGIIHRDLKPGNLFLTQRANGAPLVKVLDFGISKARPDGSMDGVTETHNFGTMGSPPYMSPEQAKSAKHVDERSDIWSLGIILYQLVSGRLPFYAESAAEVFSQILYDEPEPLHRVAPWLSRKFSAVVMRCLEKDPDKRYPTVLDLAAILVRFASPEGRLLLDASLIPTRKSSRSISSNMSSPDLDQVGSPNVEDDEDTEVDTKAAAFMAEEPQRLELTNLFKELPARSLEDAYPRTTHALYTGEVKILARKSLARRTFLAVAGVALVGAAAAGVAMFTRKSGKVPAASSAVPSVESIAPSEILPTAEPAAADGKGVGARSAGQETSPRAGASGEQPGTANALAPDSKDPDKAARTAADAEEPGDKAKDPDPEASTTNQDKADTRKSSSKRKRVRRGKRKKTRTGTGTGTDPFGTIR